MLESLVNSLGNDRWIWISSVCLNSILVKEYWKFECCYCKFEAVVTKELYFMNQPSSCNLVLGNLMDGCWK